jgi:hypothetical protein
MFILKWRSWAGGRRQLQKVIVMMTTFPTNFRLSSSSFSLDRQQEKESIDQQNFDSCL